jgi:hypothetical protein
LLCLLIAERRACFRGLHETPLRQTRDTDTRVLQGHPCPPFQIEFSCRMGPTCET